MIYVQYYRPDTTRRHWRQLPQCPLVNALVPLKCSSTNLKLHHRVPFTKEKMPWCPCPFKNEVYSPGIKIKIFSECNGIFVKINTACIDRINKACYGTQITRAPRLSFHIISRSLLFQNWNLWMVLILFLKAF